MPKKPKVPAISKKQFDAIEPQLVAALRKWWKDEAQSFDAAVAGTAPVWEGMPEIDSKAVVKASPIVERFLGVELDPRLIRRGGYSSFDDLAKDLSSKLRESCPVTLKRQPPPPIRNESNVDSINVRRS
jgi:hypothetical protein